MNRTYVEDIYRKELGKTTKITERLYGGMMNVSYLLKNSSDKTYIMYLPNGKANKIVNRKNELAVHKIAYELGLTKENIYFDTTKGIKINEYIPGSSLDKLDSFDYDKVAELLHLFHDSNTLAPNDYQPLNRLAYFENKALSYTREKNEYRYLRDFFSSQYNHLANLPKVLCHNDAQKSNIIAGNDGKYYLIDFEFAGNNDPLYDIATFANNSIEEGEELLRHYLVKPTKEEWRRFYLWRIFISLQWHVVAIGKHYQKEGNLTKYNFLQVANYFLANAKLAKEKYLLIK